MCLPLFLTYIRNANITISQSGYLLVKFHQTRTELPTVTRSYSVVYNRMLQGGSADSKEDGGPQFAEVFVIIWFGAVVITLNSKLLGGTM